MSCCNKKNYNEDKKELNSHIPEERKHTKVRVAKQYRKANAGLDFKYTGHSKLVVYGTVSGNIYRFNYPGAVVSVNRKDVDTVIYIQKLQQL